MFGRDTWLCAPDACPARRHVDAVTGYSDVVRNDWAIYIPPQSCLFSHRSHVEAGFASGVRILEGYAQTVIHASVGSSSFGWW